MKEGLLIGFRKALNLFEAAPQGGVLRIALLFNRLYSKLREKGAWLASMQVV
jgi:hypothetical protein